MVIEDRVFVTLKRDKSGYPPWDEEEIWASKLGSDTFRLEASPTFVRGLSYRDIVHAVPVGDRWYVDSVVASGGHSTLRRLKRSVTSLCYSRRDRARGSGTTRKRTSLSSILPADP